ncbi:hypothetical protein N8J89_03775 [Crossiella sp. CA-258035]|uniref:hypothetical protein n=1 Tax=Crossiella sp. CA-258035 TaxID=2981138 RepID=UPI0024BC90F8|nr:hypothetical protein [Crossiella sp. CA-258035]WHT20203.1 hypothetical protein N8J89_03775 [Crossiella sp. CA-258035]
MRTADGRHLLGAVDYERTRQALLHRLCQVCGRPLHERLVLLMRLSDLPRRCTSEPALHPECHAYTVSACPMVNGHLTHYRSTPVRPGPGTTSAPDTCARLGKPAEPWFSVWLAGYQVGIDHGNHVASYAHTKPLRIRPVTWNLPALW